MVGFAPQTGQFARLGSRDRLEPHVERVVDQQLADQRLTNSQDQLDRFGCLDRPDRAGQNAEHTRFGAAWNQVRRRGRGEQAAVTRPLFGIEHAHLSLEAKNAPIDQRLAEHNRGIIQQVARREIVGAVHDDVIGRQDFQRVLASTAASAWVSNRDMGVDAAQPQRCRIDFGHAERALAVHDLALQIGDIHHVKIHQPRLPTPAAARYIEIGLPNPPVPTTITRACLSLSCPSRPTWGRMIWRL